MYCNALLCLTDTEKGAFPGDFGAFGLASETAYILFLQRSYI